MGNLLIESSAARLRTARVAKTRTRCWVVGSALLLAAASSAPAAVFYDGFDYPTGDLHLSVNPGNSATWYSSATSSTDDRIQVAGGNLTAAGLPASVGNSITFGGTGRTDRIAVGNYNSGTVYYSVLLKITDLTGTAAAGGAILGFNNTAQTVANDGTAAQPSNIEDRVLIKSLSATTYQIGLDKGTGTAANFVFDPTIYNVNDTQFIVGSYKFNTGSGTDDTTELYINPSSATFADDSLKPTPTLTNSTGTDNSTIATFLFRQSSAVVPAGIQADELRVDSTWSGVTSNLVPEPGSLSLLGIASLAMLRRRRMA